MLRTWSWLPLWLRSLDPLDRQLSRLTCCAGCLPQPLDGAGDAYANVARRGSPETDDSSETLVRNGSSSAMLLKPTEVSPNRHMLLV